MNDFHRPKKIRIEISVENEGMFRDHRFAAVHYDVPDTQSTFEIAGRCMKAIHEEILKSCEERLKNGKDDCSPEKRVDTRGLMIEKVSSGVPFEPG
jgi:hypothetical protein